MTPTVSDAFWLEARQLQADHLFNKTGRLSSFNHEYIYIASINMSQQHIEQALDCRHEQIQEISLLLIDCPMR